MDANIKQIFQNWKIPIELHEKAYEIVKIGGLTLVNENFDYYIAVTAEYLQQLEKEIRGYVLFEAESWYQMNDILNEIFEFNILNSFGLFDEDELYNKLEKKDLLYFRDKIEGRPEKTIVCFKGYKLTEDQKKEVLKSYEKWRKEYLFWDEIKNRQ